MPIGGRGKLLAGLAAAAAAGAAFFYLREKRTWSPPYEVEEADGAVELRRYPALTVAETVQPGKRDRALGNGFGVLADYIFGESRGGEALPMTVPVLAMPAGAGAWLVRFVMQDGRGIDALPAPGPGVTLAGVAARRVAAIRFGGRADDRLLAAKELELRGWLRERGLAGAAAAEHAFYNSPMIPGPLRQNEVLVELDQKENGT